MENRIESSAIKRDRAVQLEAVEDVEAAFRSAFFNADGSPRYGDDLSLIVEPDQAESRKIHPEHIAIAVIWAGCGLIGLASWFSLF